MTRFLDRKMISQRDKWVLCWVAGSCISTNRRRTVITPLLMRKAGTAYCYAQMEVQSLEITCHPSEKRESGSS